MLVLLRCNSIRPGASPGLQFPDLQRAKFRRLWGKKGELTIPSKDLAGPLWWRVGTFSSILSGSSTAEKEVLRRPPS